MKKKTVHAVQIRELGMHQILAAEKDRDENFSGSSVPETDAGILRREVLSFKAINNESPWSKEKNVEVSKKKCGKGKMILKHVILGRLEIRAPQKVCPRSLYGAK